MSGGRGVGERRGQSLGASEHELTVVAAAVEAMAMGK